MLMIDCSTRALWQRTGHNIVSPQETSSRALCAAQRVAKRKKLISDKRSKDTNTGISSGYDEEGKFQWVQKNPVTRADLESIGKRLRKRFKASRSCK